MKLTREERAARRASFREMGLADKADYLFTYYRLPITLGVVALVLICSGVYRRLTKKESLLYAACVNVSVGSELESRLNDGFLSAADADPRKAEVYLYEGLYLSDDPSPENHEYGYASKLKIIASIEAKQLDVALMNREAYDIFSQNGYLLDLSGLLSQDEALYAALEPYLTENTVILEDNAIEYNLGEAHRYEAVTEDVVNGLEVSSFPLLRQAGFPDSVYIGVVANSPRLPVALQYIRYLASAPGNL